jgi:phosphoribosyl-ATP pyrophosphohydrolase
MSNDIIEELTRVLESRKNADPTSSYVAALYSKGLDAILKKVGEEATETVLAAKDGDRQHIVHETADLWFHTMVMLLQFDIQPSEVLLELKARFGTSGLAEKESRKK